MTWVLIIFIGAITSPAITAVHDFKTEAGCKEAAAIAMAQTVTRSGRAFCLQTK